MPSESDAPAGAADDEIDLVGMIDELHRRYGVQVSYQRLWAVVVSKRAPCRRVGNRLRARRSDTSVIAEVLGIAPADPIPIPPTLTAAA